MKKIQTQKKIGTEVKININPEKLFAKAREVNLMAEEKTLLMQSILSATNNLSEKTSDVKLAEISVTPLSSLRED